MHSASCAVVTGSAPRKLFIVGTGGFARETAQAVLAMNSVRMTYDLVGHLDDNPDLHGAVVDGVPVCGAVETVHDHAEAAVVVATGRPTDYFSRRRLVQRMDLPEDRFATIVHPAASLAQSASVGVGSVVLAGAVATATMAIGRHVAVMPGCVLTHDVVVHDYATLASGVLVAGSVTIEEGAYVGAGVRIREGLRIGAWSFVGMGALVTHDVPNAEVWFGFPAERRGSVDLPDDFEADS